MDTHETKIFIAISIAAILFAVIFLFFIITILWHQRKNAFLYEKQIRAEITTLETERKRIASDLHDELGPVLSSIKLHINILNTSTEQERESIIAKTSNYIDGILQKVRETSNDLMPNVLLRKGLFVAIVEFAEDINKTKGLKINIQNSANHLNLSSVKEIHLYRIIQETINNSIKHAKATVFNINIFVVNENLQVELSDNGKGFDYRLVLKDGTGSGLRNILSRVEILNGEMFLDTKPGAGVIYTISVPLKADK